MPRWRKLGIVAGAGALPHLLAAAEHAPFVVRLAGITDRDFSGFANVECGLAEVGKILKNLSEAGCDAVVLAGIVRRPDFSQLKPDWRGAALLPRVVAAAAKGDGPMLSVLVAVLEEEGFRVIGSEEVLSDLCASAGAIGALRPSLENWSDIRKAAAVVNALGPFDVGQGAVVASGQVLAVEAAEGTDAMLERCVSLDSRGGVLVKRPKPGQELRVDLPTVGVETVKRAAAAGLAGIAVEAGSALIIDREATVREADACGIFLYGFTPTELGRP